MVIYMIAKKMNFFLIIFAFISIITLYSARSILPSNLDNIYVKQTIIYLIGLIIFFLLKSNKLFFEYITIEYVISCFFLLALLIFTTPINNAKCWFTIPLIGTIQPSEFVKIFLIIFLATILTKETKYKWFKILIAFIIPAILTYLEPDTGLVIIYIIGTLTMILCYLKKYKYLIIPIIILLIIGLTAIFLYQYKSELLLSILGDSFLVRINRIINWQNQDGYQLNNALTAIGANGVNISFDKINTYFPEAHTDFIFATIASSFGYFFTIIFLIIILLFDLFLLNISLKEKNKTNKLIIIGFVSMIIYEQIQHIGMNIGLLPITGITLPFISYGGSSLTSSILMLTIIKNMQQKKE